MPTTYAHHFRRNDKTLHAVAKRVGPCQLKPNRDRFGMLVRSIISQQISVGAARAIRGRLENLAGAGGIRPETLAALTLPQLRSAGLSPQKASYIHDLAEKVVGDEVQLSQIGRLSDEAVIESLIQVKGIGALNGANVPHLCARPPGRISDRRFRRSHGHRQTIWFSRTSSPSTTPRNRRRLEPVCLHRQLVLLAVSRFVQSRSSRRESAFCVAAVGKAYRFINSKAPAAIASTASRSLL